MTRLVSEVTEDRPFDCVPLRILVGIDFVADTLMRCKRALPDFLNGIDLNRTQYFSLCYSGFLVVAQQGVGVAVELNEFWDVLSTQTPSLQHQVRQALAARRPNFLRQRARHLINASGLLERIELYLRPDLKRGSEISLDGAEAGFTNIFECASRVQNLTNRSAYGLA